jgi:hypothetical protein
MKDLTPQKLLERIYSLKYQHPRDEFEKTHNAAINDAADEVKEYIEREEVLNRFPKFIEGDHCVVAVNKSRHRFDRNDVVTVLKVYQPITGEPYYTVCIYGNKYITDVILQSELR